MNKILFQTTLQNPVTFEGVGLHTGKYAEMTIHPAPAGSGIRFQRIDQPGEPIIPALAEYATKTTRGTTISNNGTSVSTIEHILAALAGMQIDNALITINCDEVPILDGSAKPYVEQIRESGLKQLPKPRKYFRIPETIELYDTQKDAYICAEPGDEFEVSVQIDYNSPVLGVQEARLSKIANFGSEIAACRTFCFLHELEMLANANLIKGGSLSNAIVIVDRKLPEAELRRLSDIFHKPNLKVLDEGILSNVELAFDNEPARHKLLDVIGDLALVGFPLKGKITARKPGHDTNVAFAQKLRSMAKNKSQAPVYNPNKEPIFNTGDIKKFLPHRHPFLLVDKIIHMDETSVVGIKNVTYDEYFFKGHFPDDPVFPGVLTIEALAQTGGVYVLNQVENPSEYLTFFLKIKEARFKHMVIPGDTLVLQMELIAPIRRGICEMHGTAWVGNKLVAEGDLVAQIAKKEKK